MPLIISRESPDPTKGQGTGWCDNCAEPLGRTVVVLRDHPEEGVFCDNDCAEGVLMTLPDDDEPRMTKPRLVARLNGLANDYLQKDGTWGGYKTAKRFKDDAAIERFVEKEGIKAVYGVFPVSMPRKINPS